MAFRFDTVYIWLMLKYLLATGYLWIGAATFALLLGPAAAHAQMLDSMRGLHIQKASEGISPGPRSTLDGPRPKGPSSVIYLDGQRRDSTTLARLSPDDIATVSVLKADVARRLGPAEAQRGVIIITTKAGEHTRAVRAFDKRLNKLRLASPPPARSPE
jgi:hypothetical protein